MAEAKIDLTQQLQASGAIPLPGATTVIGSDITEYQAVTLQLGNWVETLFPAPSGAVVAPQWDGGNLAYQMQSERIFFNSLIYDGGGSDGFVLAFGPTGPFGMGGDIEGYGGSSTYLTPGGTVPGSSHIGTGTGDMDLILATIGGSRYSVYVYQYGPTATADWVAHLITAGATINYVHSTDAGQMVFLTGGGSANFISNFKMSYPDAPTIKTLSQNTMIGVLPLTQVSGSFGVGFPGGQLATSLGVIDIIGFGKLAIHTLGAMSDGVDPGVTGLLTAHRVTGPTTTVEYLNIGFDGMTFRDGNNDEVIVLKHGVGGSDPIATFGNNSNPGIVKLKSVSGDAYVQVNPATGDLEFVDTVEGTKSLTALANVAVSGAPWLNALFNTSVTTGGVILGFKPSFLGTTVSVGNGTDPNSAVIIGAFAVEEAVVSFSQDMTGEPTNTYQVYVDKDAVISIATGPPANSTQLAQFDWNGAAISNFQDFRWNKMLFGVDGMMLMAGTYNGAEKPMVEFRKGAVRIGGNSFNIDEYVVHMSYDNLDTYELGMPAQPGMILKGYLVFGNNDAQVFDDGTGNLTFVDSTTGTKTLADLSTPPDERYTKCTYVNDGADFGAGSTVDQFQVGGYSIVADRIDIFCGGAPAGGSVIYRLTDGTTNIDVTVADGSQTATWFVGATLLATTNLLVIRQTDNTTIDEAKVNITITYHLA